MPTPSLLSKVPDTGVHTNKPENSSLYHSAGLGIMVLNKIRTELRGYRGTRGFSVELFKKAVAYDFSVINRWADYLEQYKTGASNLAQKNVLELGPGSDLGIGLITLAHGANSYHSLDVHHLIKFAPDELYTHLFETFNTMGYDAPTIENLKKNLALFKEEKESALNYTCDPDFNIGLFKDNKIDLILSNSAYQQFTDVEKSIQQMSDITASGAMMVSLIDLSTHTRWIGQKDPLNIYRYSNAVYNAFTFKGSPNRVRPYQYEKYLKDNGWTDIKIYPRLVLEADYIKQVVPKLDKQFRDPINQMENSTVVLCATKA